MSTITITQFDNAVHREQLIALWELLFGYKEPHNEPGLVIDKKLAVNDGMLFVAVEGGVVLGSAMAGYDGHRGWIYSIAVSPAHRRQGIGSRLMKHSEEALIATGCVKINLQILAGNEGVAAFYESLGFAVEKRVNMGKRIEENILGR